MTLGAAIATPQIQDYYHPSLDAFLFLKFFEVGAICHFCYRNETRMVVQRGGAFFYRCTQHV